MLRDDLSDMDAKNKSLLRALRIIAVCISVVMFLTVSFVTVLFMNQWAESQKARADLFVVVCAVFVLTGIVFSLITLFSSRKAAKQIRGEWQVFYKEDSLSDSIVEKEWNKEQEYLVKNIRTMDYIVTIVLTVPAAGGLLLKSFSLAILYAVVLALVWVFSIFYIRYRKSLIETVRIIESRLEHSATEIDGDGAKVRYWKFSGCKKCFSGALIRHPFELVSIKLLEPGKEVYIAIDTKNRAKRIFDRKDFKR